MTEHSLIFMVSIKALKLETTPSPTVSMRYSRQPHCTHLHSVRSFSLNVTNLKLLTT